MTPRPPNTGDPVERIGRGLASIQGPLPTHEVLTRIAGRSPAQLAEGHRSALLRRACLAAGALWAALLVAGWSGGDAETAREEWSSAPEPPLLTLEEDGFGTYSSASLVFQSMLVAEYGE